MCEVCHSFKDMIRSHLRNHWKVRSWIFQQHIGRWSFVSWILLPLPLKIWRMLSCFSCVWLFVIPRTVARQASLSLGFSRQEYWRELPFPSPGDLPDPGNRTGLSYISCIAGGFFTTNATWEAQNLAQGSQMLPFFYMFIYFQDKTKPCS